jgi:hypothetical protein
MKDVPFRGVVDSAHFSSHEKRNYPKAYTGKHLANYSQRLSIISKQSKLIPKELRYQEKIHSIIYYAKRKKKSCKFSPKFFLFCFFFIIIFIILKNTISKNIICKARSNLMMPIQKNSHSTFLFCLRQKVPAKFSQEKYGAKHNWFLDFIKNITSKISNQT